jgi:hypothetical protein
MNKAFSSRDGATYLLALTIAGLMGGCVLTTGAPGPETALPMESAPVQRPIMCDADKDSKNFESADCLQRVQGLAAREGDVLRLNLENGQAKIYTSNSKACAEGPNNCSVFQLIAFYPSMPAFLVSASYYECGHYELVSRRSGSVVKISATSVPDLSPGGKYLASTDQNDACDRGDELAIWSTSADPPVAEFKYKARRYENWTVTGWRGDDRIGLAVFINDREGAYDLDAEAVRSGKGWKLVMGRKVKRDEEVVRRKPSPLPPAASPPPPASR